MNTLFELRGAALVLLATAGLPLLADRVWTAPQSVSDDITVSDGETLLVNGAGTVALSGVVTQQVGTAWVKTCDTAMWSLEGKLVGHDGTIFFDREQGDLSEVTYSERMNIGVNTKVAQGYKLSTLVGLKNTVFYQDDTSLETTATTVGGSRVFFFANDGQKASCQVQINQGGWNKCMFLELTQSGTDIYCKVIKGRAMDIAKAPVDGTYDFAAHEGEPGMQKLSNYNLRGITLQFDNENDLVATAVNTQENAIWHLTNGFNMVVNTESFLPKTGSVHVWSNSVLKLNAKAVSGPNGGQVDIVAHPNSVIEVGASHALGRDVSKGAVLDGALLRFTAEAGYIRYLTLKNGAVVAHQAVGQGIWVGYNTDAGTWKVSGNKPSRIDADFRLVSSDSLGARSHTFDVDDVTGDDAPDLELYGVFQNYDKSNTKGYLIKRGEGTLALCKAAAKWDDASEYLRANTNLMHLVEGTLLCSVSQALSPKQALSLDGGTLAGAAGCTNEVAVLQLSENSAIALGEGATFVFADQAGQAANWAPEKTIEVTGAYTPTSIRFGTDGSALTRGQQRAFRYQGCKMKIDDNGYLVKAGGLIVVVR